MGFLALDLGGLTPILYSFIERDEIVEMLAALTGARMLFNYFRIGGVNGDLNHEFLSRLGDWMSRAARQTEANTGLLNENEIFVRRMRGLGVLDRATALSVGVTGGNLRASGVPFDVRRAHPYSVYPQLEFNVPTREEGDSLARYLIRVDEVRESIRIIDQCLNNMPDGPVMAKLPRLLRPRPGRAWGAVEGPRGDARRVRHQRRLGPAVPLPHPRPELRQPGDGADAPAGEPAGGHDGDRLVAGPGHGRDRQVRATR